MERYDGSDKGIPVRKLIVGRQIFFSLRIFYRAKWEAPDCLRAKYGLGDTRNGFHGSGEGQSSQYNEAHIDALPSPLFQTRQDQPSERWSSSLKVLHSRHG